MQSPSCEFTLPDIMIVDNFCTAIDFVRASALGAGFGTWRPSKGEIGSSVYEGMGWGGHSAMMNHSLAHHLRCRVFPNLSFFRVTKRGIEKAYTHSDRESGSWTAVAYLSEHKESTSTGFFQHRKTGLREMPTFEEMRRHPRKYAQLKRDMVKGGEKEWKKVGECEAQYNRCLIFRAPLFHARLPREGLGTTDKNARLTWVNHFEVLP